MKNLRPHFTAPVAIERCPILFHAAIAEPSSAVNAVRPSKQPTI
jgi:hypothetical protein